MAESLAVLVSGTGSILKAILEQGIPVDMVIADRDCPALQIGAQAQIPSVFLSRSFNKYFDRDSYTKAMVELLQQQDIDLVAMTGFMTIFMPAMFAPDAYKLKVLNTHPSLLPAFKGHHAVKDALEYGVKVTGCTIHWATEDLDAGPIVVQEAVKVLPGDTVESLQERIKTVERVLYPALLRELISA